MNDKRLSFDVRVNRTTNIRNFHDNEKWWQFDIIPAIFLSRLGKELSITFSWLFFSIDVFMRVFFYEENKK